VSKAGEVLTIGYERATPSTLVAALRAAGVQTLVDVRALANSRKPGFAKGALSAALQEAGIGYLHLRALGTPAEGRAAVRAGHMQRRFRDRGGRRERVVADFLIGAHALLQCGALITRDASFFRDYFKGLKVIVPKGT